MASPEGRAQHRLILYAVTAIVAAAGVTWGLYLIRGVLLLVYVSALLAIGFAPAVGWFENRRVRWLRRNVSRGAAILIFYVLCLIATALLLAVIVPPFVKQAAEMWAALPTTLDALQRSLVEARLLSQRWTWSELLAKIPSPELAVSSLVSALQSALGALGALATILVLPYYLLVESDDLHRGFLRFFPEDRRERAGRVTANVAQKVGAWLGSQMLLCGIIGALASVALWILGLPYFYVLGLLAGLAELVPVVGPLIAALLAVLLGWSISVKMAILVASYFALQQIVENYVLIPRIMQRRVGVSAVTVIVALLVGTELLGVVGALLAVPTAAIVQVLLGEYLHGDER